MKTKTEKRVGLMRGSMMWLTAPGTDEDEASALARDGERVVRVTLTYEVPE